MFFLLTHILLWLRCIIISMAKRRTRRQKVKARETFTVSWNPRLATGKQLHVKGQIRQKQFDGSTTLTKFKNTAYSDKNEDSASFTRDVFKSIMLAGFILSLELVIYFVSKI